ncbi:alpha/beta hydrolase [Intrasporangium chromatireducens Q5-1]|uniref:Alpha/beta hydrolase n=1 Tax=Intrasporangium chromatireducens Q5-1 TaxID=584657 RepID=W9GGS8_9MICO|nr:alpha/beta hydrolase [Intrasporangium chromatireducens]EWT04402.1 alpha/beta hydrolase [Intrasporangium chromatireducens Q5-1]
MVPHLVLVHGSRLSAAQWAPQQRLLEGRVTLGLVDLPGHGARAAETFTLDRCVEVIDAAVDAAPAKAPVILVGHSLGGYAAMTYAAQHSSRLTGLVLAGCSATPVGAGATIYRWVARITDRVGEARMTRLNDAVLRRLYTRDLIEPVIAGGYFFTPTAAAWQQVMDTCRPSMLWGVTCPVLLLSGQYDQFRVGTAEFLRACPSARAEVIPRASHLANLDQPEAFAAALLRFADSVCGP